MIRSCLTGGGIGIWVFVCMSACAFDKEDGRRIVFENNDANRWRMDCAVNALYMALRLMQVNIGIDELKSRFPPEQSKGYSMREIQEVAKRCGVSLKGVRVEQKDLPLSNPAIIYLYAGGEGHFAVLRSVGVYGKLVQMIDPPFSPKVFDFESIRKSSEWSGYALIPVGHTGGYTRSSWFMAIAAAVLGACVIALRQYASRRVTHPDESHRRQPM